MTTYEEFLDSAERMSVNGAANLFHLDPEDYGWDDYKAVLVYMERCYIGICHDGVYHLLIENMEWHSRSLSDLEPILFDWYQSAVDAA